MKRLSGFLYVSRLVSFRSLSYFKLNFLAFLESLIAVTCYCAVVHEHILAVFAGDEAITLLIAAAGTGGFLIAAYAIFCYNKAFKRRPP